MSYFSDSDDKSVGNKKVGKKIYQPFGSSSSQRHAYSEYVHLNNPQTQVFAKTLATAAIEPIQVIEQKPKRIPKRLKSPSKNDSGKSGDDDDSKLGIPDAIGLEPCIKLGCQLILRALSDQQYSNEIEREDIEDEYERLLIELAAAEQEIAITDKKLVNLNDVQRQLEHRNNQVQMRVEELENLKEKQKHENTDLNNKIMVHQTEKSKFQRIFEKAQKTLSDAKWRKKKQEQDQDVEAGLSLMGGSIISERPIKKSDHSTVTSLSNVYNTSYNLLASGQVLDHIEQPPLVKSIPQFVREELSSSPQRFDKYAKKHYKHLEENGLKAWSRSMEGSLTTAHINSPATFGSSFDTAGLSYDEYTRADHHSLTQHKGSSRLLSSSLSTAASSRVGSILRSRSNTSISSTNSNNNKSRNNLKHSTPNKQQTMNQIRLAPINNHNLIRNEIINTSHFLIDPTKMPGSSGENNHFLDPNGFLKNSNNSVSSPSNLSAITDELSTVIPIHHKLDPVFYKEKQRTSWGRGNPVGKVRTAEVTWGMQAYKNINNNNNSIDDVLLMKAASPMKNINSKGSDNMKNEVPRMMETVRTRSLTVYHPHMNTFQDSLHLHQQRLKPTGITNVMDGFDSDDSI